METRRGPHRPLLIVGGNRALDLANTVDEPGLPNEFDHLGDPRDALAWAVQVGLVPPEQQAALARAAEAEGAAAAVRRLRRLRQAVSEVFGAVVDETVPPEPAWTQLGRAAAEAVAAARPVPGDGHRVRLYWELADLGALAWPPAYAALDLLTSGPLDRVKRCAACPWLYLDRSKNGSRRWCTMDDCGKRTKMDRYVRKRAAARRASDTSGPRVRP